MPYVAGWKAVIYRSVEIDVPSSWVVEPWHANCGVDVPTVFIGPEGTNSLGCPTLGLGAVVILDARTFSDTGLRPRTETIHGLKAEVTETSAIYHGHLSGTITNIFVVLPADAITISVSVGEESEFPGGGPGRAGEIVSTIHPVSEATP